MKVNSDYQMVAKLKLAKKDIWLQKFSSPHGFWAKMHQDVQKLFLMLFK
jgi:hypothetical protein